MLSWRKATALVFCIGLGLSVFSKASESKEEGGVGKGTMSYIKRTYLSNLKAAGFKPSELEVYSIGQSHIDAAWRWRLSQTRNLKCPSTFGKALKHIDQYPTFNYHQSAPQYYEWVKEVDPAMFQKVVQAEKEGRWSLVGGMWIEPDCNMPEGESFARQQLYGQRFFLENFGHISEIAWLLDSFGYNWNLPQFAAKAGQKYMWTSKLTWNAHNIFPFHLFWWQAPDGSKVLTHVCPIVPVPEWFPFQELTAFSGNNYALAPGGDIGGVPLTAGYKQTRYLLKPGEQLTASYLTTPEEITSHLSKDFMPVIGAFYGYGDGGNGPLGFEIREQLALEKLGYAKIGTALELFHAFDNYADRAPTWNDEMYLEYHQGVMTTHEWIKRANRKAEAVLRTAEAASSTAFLFGAQYPMTELVKLWKITLLNQFHDILPGSSIPEVYKDARAQHKQIQDEAGKLVSNSLEFLAEKIDTTPPRENLGPILVFNPLGWDRTDAVKMPVKDQGPYIVYNQDWKELPTQTAADEEGKLCLYFLPDPVPGLGWKTFFLGAGYASGITPRPLVTETSAAINLENELVSVSVDKKTGLLTSLYDKRLRKEFIKRPSFKILAFTDIAKVYTAWNIADDYEKMPVPVPEVTSIKLDSQGAVFARILIERKGDPTSFKQWITLFSNSPLVQMITKTDMHWHMTLVKIEFNTTVRTEKVAADIPYAVIERSTHPKVAWDAARTEMPCQKWADLSNDQEGIALVNFGKYGFSLNQDGAGFRMSIIKAAKYPKPIPNARKVNTVFDFIPTLDTDQGEHWAHLALLPHPKNWREAQVYRAGYEFNTPMAVCSAPVHKGELPPASGILSLDSPSAYIADLKKAEDDDSLVVRVVESAGKDTSAVLKAEKPFKVLDAAETDLIELNPRPLNHDRQSVSFPVGHFEIKTIKLKLAK